MNWKLFKDLFTYPKPLKGMTLQTCSYCHTAIPAGPPTGDLILSSERHCFNCNARWVTYYKAVSFKIIQGPDLQTLQDFHRLGYDFEFKEGSKDNYSFFCKYRNTIISSGYIVKAPDDNYAKIYQKARQEMLRAAQMDFDSRFPKNS